MKNHNCDNVNCNHNNTKGLCCLFNPENCKYRQLQKENAELKEKYAKNITDCDICDTYCNSQLTNAKEIIKKFLLWENDWHNKTESKYELLKQAEQFLKDCEVEK